MRTEKDRHRRKRKPAFQEQSSGKGNHFLDSDTPASPMLLLHQHIETEETLAELSAHLKAVKTTPRAALS